MGEEARRGQMLYQQHNCTACHQFYGLGGYMGPDLTNVISNRGEAYSRAFISAGTARMPNFGLNEEEVSALVTYLGFVDQTGTYPPENFDVLWTGWVTQEDDPQ
jgi:nitric oxide reductase subunit C